MNNNNQSGFALLMTLIVVSIVISVGVSLLDLSIKQVRLSTNAKDSEIAFHAANAGMECARYWRDVSSVEMLQGQDIVPTCFSQPAVSVAAEQLPTESPISSDTVVDGDGEAFVYEYEFTWGADQRCTKINTVVASSTSFLASGDVGSGLTIENIGDSIPGYPDGNDKYCEPGARCTVISVRGYNRSCSAVNNDVRGIVQREVLLQF